MEDREKVEVEVAVYSRDDSTHVEMSLTFEEKATLDRLADKVRAAASEGQPTIDVEELR